MTTTQANNDLLTAQHREMELGINGLVDGSGSRAEFDAAVRLLRRHIYVEEVALFPVIDTDGRRAMAVAQMEFEHGEMWAYIEQALALIEARAPLDDMLPAAEAMMRLLRMHDAKEEEAIYAVAGRYDEAAGQKPLAGWFAATDPPSGWRCRAYRCQGQLRADCY